MGGVHPDGHPRRLRGGDSLTWWLLAGALAGEIEVRQLGEGASITVQGAPASHGTTAKGLPAGTHTVMVYGDEGRLLGWKPVMVGAEERVVLQGSMLVELERGPAPALDATDDAEALRVAPQWLDVAVADRAMTRVHVDGRPVAYDMGRGAHALQLAHGVHELSITVGGRRRHQSSLAIEGAPWRCGVDPAGTATCVELAPSAAQGPPMDVEGVVEQLARTSPSQRLEALRDLPGTVQCADVATLMEAFIGDQERLQVAQLLRARVVDPNGYQLVQEAVSFSQTKQAIGALYGTR